jgi:APA family basic amino acid/polyamine antiporter
VSASESPGPAGLTFWSATALVIAHTIAVGIFLAPAELIGALASPALTLGLWIGCGALALAGAVTFGELAARYPLAGGPYIYLREAWGARTAFLYGWQSFLIMDPGVTAALATGASQYLVVLWPGTAGRERWIAIALIWMAAVVGAAGLTLSARVLRLMTIVKLLTFAAVVALAFTSDHGTWSNFEPFVDRHRADPPIGEALAVALVSAFFAFGGFWEASRVAGEVQDARRTMPAALAIGVVSVAAVYFATTLAFIYLVPVEQVTGAADFAQRAGEAMLGRAGPRALASVVVLSVAASVLALMIMGPRLYVAMSRDGTFPSEVAAVNARSGSPARATLLLAAIATLFVALGTFEQIVAFFMCTTLAFIALAAAALLVLQRGRGPRAADVPLVPRMAPVLFILLVAVVVMLVAVNRPVQALAGAAVVLLGWPAHRLFMQSTGGVA